jgi:hypothetical protein
MRMNQCCSSKEERNERKGDGRSHPGIYDMLVELTVHGRAATLKRASKDDEGDDPSGICIHEILLCV